VKKATERARATRDRDSRFAIRATRRDATRRAIARESPAAIER